MKTLVSLFDRIGQNYGQPMFAPNLGAAMRSIGDEVNRVAEGNVLHAHAEDFEVHVVGLFDEFTGEFHFSEKNIVSGEMEPVKRVVCRADALRR